LKSPIHLLQVLLDELGQRCGVSTNLDFKRIKARYEVEGYSFLGITLANYGKDFERSLDQEFVSPDLFLGFKKRAGLPELFRGFLENIFIPNDGRLNPDPCIECIHSVRQITLMWAKLKEPTTPERETKAFASYMEREKRVSFISRALADRDQPTPNGAWDYRQRDETVQTDLEGNLLGLFRRMAGRLYGNTLSEIDFQLSQGDVLPAHGSGSTAERLTGNAKWDALRNWPDQLERVFPYQEFAQHRFVADEPELDNREPRAVLPVKVITVPKTREKPRIIAMESVSMMFMQQAVMRLFEEVFDKPHVGGAINFAHFFCCYRSQIPNQEMALKGSRDGSLATLDLSDASDSVSLLLVEALLSGHSYSRDAVMATRSPNADVQGHGIISLAKFASMGSALCFPIEAMVFTTVVFIGIQRALARPLTNKDIKSFIGKVRVYGDDIIVPVEYARSVKESLEAFGFDVNSRKSFWTGKFRESCGKDYYDGQDVSIARLRNQIPTSRRDVDSLISYVSLRNQLYKLGLWKTVRRLDDYIEKILITFPAVNEGTAVLGKISFLGFETHKMDPNLQRPMVKAHVPIYRPRVNPLDGELALLKFFTAKRSGQTDPPSVDHLQHSGRPVSVRIKHRWIHPDYGMEPA
jgi:hypothetical protein